MRDEGPRLLTAPAPEESVPFLKDHLQTRMVQLVGSCTIDYQGRAQSTLAQGERLVIVKPDGTLLVHTSQGIKPVNWQPQGTSVQVAEKTWEEDPVLVMTVERTSPREIVTMVFDQVHFLAAYELQDDEDLDLLGTEADIQQMLAMRPELIEEGFEPYDMELDRRRGPMDLYGTDVHGNRVVVEVKRRTAGIKEAQQLVRYTERERALHTTVRGILAAPGISPKAKKYLDDKELEFLELDLEALIPKLPRLQAAQRTLGAFD